MLPVQLFLLTRLQRSIGSAFGVFEQEIVDAVILCSKACSDCGIHQRAGQPRLAATGGACDDSVLAIANPIATGQSFNQSAVQIAVRRVQSILNTRVRVEAC